MIANHQYFVRTNSFKTLYSKGKRAAQTPFGLLTRTETSSSFIESLTPLFESSKSFTRSVFLLSWSFVAFTLPSSELKSVNGFHLLGIPYTLVFGVSVFERVLEDSAPEYVTFFDCGFDGGTFWDWRGGGQFEGRGLEEGAGSKENLFLTKKIIHSCTVSWFPYAAMFTKQPRDGPCGTSITENILESTYIHSHSIAGYRITLTGSIRYIGLSNQNIVNLDSLL